MRGFRPLIFLGISSLTFVKGATQWSDGAYVIETEYKGDDFFSCFEFQTFDDPTHGRVNYLSKAEAKSKKLAYVSNGKFVMKADSASVVESSARGRDSIRIQSYTSFSDSIFVLDLTHMPERCGTWPAFWTKSKDGPWPAGGEIDIIEGVNKNQNNLASMHTLPNCTMPEYAVMKGKQTSLDCDVNANFNQGCGANFTGLNTYGSSFNRNGGGWYAMHRSRSQGVAVYFWPRTSTEVPSAVSRGYGLIQPDYTWGVPQAYFPFTSSCDYGTHFDAHKMVFDLTFCGDWAGGTAYGAAGCPSKCVDYVDNNPSAFAQAFWEINSLRVYIPLITEIEI